MSRALLIAAILVVAGGAAWFTLGPGHGTRGTATPPGSDPSPTGASSWHPRLIATLGDPKVTGKISWPPDMDAYPLATYDFDGDGVQEIVAHGNDTNLFVFSAKTGKILANFTTTYPPGWHVERVLNGVEIGRLAPGEPPSIVVTNHAAYVSVWQFVPSKSTADHFAFKKMWEKRMDACYAQPAMDAKPTLADLEGNGKLGIVVQTEEIGDFALRSDGSILWKQCWGGGNSAPVVADLDGDGKLEAIIASDMGFISVFDGATGRPIWTFDATKYGVLPASISVSPTVAELDGIAPKEILFTARDAHARTPGSFGDNHFAIFAIHQAKAGQSELLWKKQPSWGNPLSYTQLAAVDVDGDGIPEILGMDWNTIGHIPGNWEWLGPAHVFAFRANGDEMWMTTVDSWWSNKDIAIGDFDGSGHLQVLANGVRDGYDGLWRIDARTGALEAFLPAWPWKVERGPIVADLWGNHTMQIVLSVSALDDANTAHGRGAIMIYDLAEPWNAPWPGHQPSDVHA